MTSKWIEHVKKYQKINNVSYKVALKEAKTTYKKEGKGIYDVISRVGRWIASKRKDPRLGLAIPTPGYESRYGAPQGWCGPFNETNAKYQRDYPPKTRSEQACMFHDLDYDKCLAKKGTVSTEEFNKCIGDADAVILNRMDRISPDSIPERILKGVSYAAIKSKTWLDKITGAGTGSALQDPSGRMKRTSKYGLL